MLLEIKEEGSIYKGLWAWDKRYSIDNELFTPEFLKNQLKQTGMKLLNLNDWWTPLKGGDQPEYSWKELIILSLKIMNSDATRLLFGSMHLGEIPEGLEIKDLSPIDLPNQSVSGAKRVNADANWFDYGTNEQKLLGKFKLSGKDMSCQVEGSWLHWLALATIVLSNENTKLCCPQAYCRDLSINKFSEQ